MNASGIEETNVTKKESLLCVRFLEKTHVGRLRQDPFLSHRFFDFLLPHYALILALNYYQLYFPFNFHLIENEKNIIPQKINKSLLCWKGNGVGGNTREEAQRVLAEATADNAVVGTHRYRRRSRLKLVYLVGAVGDVLPARSHLTVL